MTQQLQLLDPAQADWKLDERTRELGRRGLARARAALRAAPVPAESPPAEGDALHHRATAA